jgi:hypothetical protein
LGLSLLCATESRYVLARAATVAVRYSAIRSQFVDAANPKKLEGTNRTVETPVINYNMVQYRLFPVIAQAYACFFTGKEMYRMYNENQERMAQGDFSYLADLHATSSGLKSLTTTISLAAIEQCRYVHISQHILMTLYHLLPFMPSITVALVVAMGIPCSLVLANFTRITFQRSP